MKSSDVKPLNMMKAADLNTIDTDLANVDKSAAAIANGVPAPIRASPTPHIPNGKAASPYVERSNPMGQGATQTVSSKDPKAAALAASDMRNVVRRKLTGYVGFANLPNQWHRKSVRKGFNFNVMVVG
jgi:septin 7